MSIVKQLPQLYARGARATVTMKTLTDSQKAHCAELTDYVASLPEMQRHRVQYRKALNDTIGGDYKELAAADQDFLIAIWQGVVDVFYHHAYSYRCEACGNSSRKTKRGRTVAIDRVQKPCPNCSKVKVTNAGGTNLHVGDYVTYDEFQESYKDILEDELAPECVSSIVPIKGEKKHDNPEKILADDTQTTKLFSEYLWSYLRQQIRENKITRQKHKITICDSGDKIILATIIDICNKYKVEHIQKTENGYHLIGFGCLHTTPEFTAEFCEVVSTGAKYGIKVEVEETLIKIKEDPTAPTLSTVVTKEENITVLGSSNDSSNSDYYSCIEQSQSTIRGQAMDHDDKFEIMELEDAVTTIQEALPEESNTRKVLEILKETGNLYDKFAEAYGEKPTHRNIKDFLNISHAEMQECLKDLRLYLLSSGIALTT